MVQNIRRNTYIGVKYGNLADEDNAVISNPPRGLHYLCNENSTERYDFYVFSGADIRRVQGVEAIQNGAAIVNSAGNHFTKSNPPWIYNNNFLYYYDPREKQYLNESPRCNSSNGVNPSTMSIQQRNSWIEVSVSFGIHPI